MEKEVSTLDKKGKFSIRDIIYIVGFIVLFLSNYLSTKYTVEQYGNEINVIDERMDAVESELKKNNYELINYKLGLIMKKLDIED